MSISSRVLLLPLVALTTACVPTMRAGPSPFDEGPDPAANDLLDMSIIVTNNHWLPMRVWVEWPDRNYFLGDVEPGSRGMFTVPGYLIGRSETLRLFADPTGSVDQVLSEPIDVTRGHRIEWQLQKVLWSSRARIM